MCIDIIIVNWNSGDQLRKCLSSLSRIGDKNLSRVVVVDNGSVDSSADGLGEFGFPVQLFVTMEILVLRGPAIKGRLYAMRAICYF